MITTINPDNVNDYIALFDEASEILSGYKRVRTYDTKIADYYYKNPKPETAKDLFLKEESINSLITFAQALKAHDILFVKYLDENGNEVGVKEGFDPMIGITSIEEYFSWLRELGQIHRKYTVLPLDEEHFEINANTRAINIPASFKKNGIAVQGDDLAEVLYFKIDRYFDYMDLNNTDIFIQWEAPKDANGNIVKSVSSAYIRDIESEPGKLIFGWAISDAITATAGTLKFSVRFFDWGKEEEGRGKTLEYSFSTLTASVTIQPSINLDLEKDEYDIDDAGERILGRLENSVIVGGYEANTPEFEVNLDNKDYDLNPETNTFNLLVQAYAGDTGAITYSWKRRGLNEDNSPHENEYEVFEGTNVFVEVTELEGLKEKGYVFYELFEGRHRLYRGPIPPTDEKVRLFVKQSQLQVTKDGIYWATAQNRLTNSISTLDSNSAIFPKAQAVNIVNEPKSAGILDNENDFKYSLNVDVDNQDGVLTYQWFKNDNSDIVFKEEEAEFTPIENANNESYEATEPGRYKVTITNTRNLTSKSKDSGISRITYSPEVPKYVINSAQQFLLDTLTPDNCPTIKLDENIQSDRYEVKWYLYENGTYYEDPVFVQNLGPGILTASFNPLEHEEKILQISSDGHLDGNYFPVIINYVNGRIASSVEEIEDFNFEDMFMIG